jgi:hypothetical protein
MSQRLIQRDEQSGLLTRIAATESYVVHADEKVTAFMELESVVRGGADSLKAAVTSRLSS